MHVSVAGRKGAAKVAALTHKAVKLWPTFTGPSLWIAVKLWSWPGSGNGCGYAQGQLCTTVTSRQPGKK